MTDQKNPMSFHELYNAREAVDLIGGLFDVAKPDRIFSKTIETENFTVITASEIMVSMGAGYGGGVSEPSPSYGEEKNIHADSTGGGGGGGGGFSWGRPVATITIGPEGVKVEPIFDRTKIIIAFIAILPAIVLSLSRTWQQKKKL